MGRTFAAACVLCSASACGLLLDIDPRLADGGAGSSDGGGGGPDGSLRDGNVRDAGADAIMCAPVETCGNMIDDDCNGPIDDGCACDRYVALGMAGSGLTPDDPLDSIQRAIDDLAAAGGRVCVACAGAPYVENIEIASGVTVAGGYELPGFAAFDCRPVLQPADPSSPIALFPSGSAGGKLEKLAIEATVVGVDATGVRIEEDGTVVESTITLESDHAVWGAHVLGAGYIATTDVDVTSTEGGSAGIRAAALRSAGDLTASSSSFTARSYQATAAGAWIEDGTATIADGQRIEGTSMAGTGLGLSISGNADVSSIESISGEGTDANGVLLQNAGTVDLINDLEVFAHVTTASSRPSPSAITGDCRGELRVESTGVATRIYVTSDTPLAMSSGIAVQGCDLVVRGNAFISGLDSGVDAIGATAIGCFGGATCSIEDNDLVIGKSGTGGALTEFADGISCVGSTCNVLRQGMRAPSETGIAGCDLADTNSCRGVFTSDGTVVADANRFLPFPSVEGSAIYIENGDVVATNNLFVLTVGRAVFGTPASSAPITLHSNTFIRTAPASNRDPFIRFAGSAELRNDLFACFGPAAPVFAAGTGPAAIVNHYGTLVFGCDTDGSAGVTMSSMLPALSTDPFVDAAGADFTLDGSSAGGTIAGNGGVASGTGRTALPARDFFGSARDAAGTPSVGFHEL